MKRLGRPEKKEIVHRCYELGMSPRQIHAETGLSMATIYKYTSKINRENAHRFDDILNRGGFVTQFYITLDSFGETMRQCDNEYQKIEETCDEIKSIIHDKMLELQMPKGALALASFINSLVTLETLRSNAKFKAMERKDAANHKRAELYTKVGTIAALDEFIKQNIPKPVNRPQLHLVNPEYIQELPPLTEVKVQEVKQSDQGTN